MEQALKPCPFCGNTPEPTKGRYVLCGNCAADGPYDEADPNGAWNRRAPTAEAQGDVAVEPVADLIKRLEKRVKFKEAMIGIDKVAFYERSDLALDREAAASIASLSERLAEARRERDDALSRVDELESEAETVSAEFEGDCWKAMRSLLTACKFSWRDVEPDGVSAEDAREYIATTLDEIEKGETRNRERAEAAEKREDELRAKLAEARETAFEEAAQIAESAAEYTEEQIAHMSVDCFGRVNDSGCGVRLSRHARKISTAIRARAFRDATSGAKS